MREGKDERRGRGLSFGTQSQPRKNPKKKKETTPNTKPKKAPTNPQTKNHKQIVRKLKWLEKDSYGVTVALKLREGKK